MTVDIDWLGITAYIIQVTPTVVGIIAGLIAGERSAHTFLKAACQIVFALAEHPMENKDKRAAAVAGFYKEFPTLARIIPDAMLGKLVDIAWEQVVKPMAQAKSVAIPDEPKS